MPFHFDFDPKNRILRILLSGETSDDGLKHAYAAGFKLAMRVKPQAGIFDFSGVKSLDVTPQTIRELAKSSPILSNPSLRRAIIAPSPHIFGVARSFEMQSEDIRPNLHVVRSEREAFAILAVQHPRFAPIDPEDTEKDPERPTS